MKTTILFMAYILCAICLCAQITSNNIIGFSWSMAGTTLSNANSFVIQVSSNGPGNYYTNINVGPTTNITVTNFPLGIEFFYRIGCYSNSTFLGYSAETAYGANGATYMPTNSTPPTPQITVTIITP